MWWEKSISPLFRHHKISHGLDWSQGHTCGGGCSTCFLSLMWSRPHLQTVKLTNVWLRNINEESSNHGDDENNKTKKLHVNSQLSYSSMCIYIFSIGFGVSSTGVVFHREIVKRSNCVRLSHMLTLNTLNSAHSTGKYKFPKRAQTPAPTLIHTTLILYKFRSTFYYRHSIFYFFDTLVVVLFFQFVTFTSAWNVNELAIIHIYFSVLNFKFAVHHYHNQYWPSMNVSGAWNCVLIYSE